MSIEATVWALKFAPPMPPQLLGVLIGLADHADSDGRGAYPSVPTLAAYACKDPRSVRRDIKALLDAGLIRTGDPRLAAHLPSGKRPEVYDLAVELTVPGGRAGDDEVTWASRVTLASSRARGGKRNPRSDSNSPDADVRGDVDVRGDAHVRDGVTPTSEWGDVDVTQTTLEPPVEPKDSSAPADAGDVGGSLAGALIFDLAGNEVTTRPAPEDLTAFGNFWLLYPKKRDRAAALTAWRAAIAAGADPARITEGARQYATERTGQDPKYTKYPATWLNKGCWDDEPDPRPGQLRAVAGDFQPFTCPPADVYANDMGF